MKEHILSRPRHRKGDKIGNRYLVYQVLTGGMGEVYLCLDLQENYPFALKTFQARFLLDQKLRDAFETEVATWIALEKHPNIVRCHTMEVFDHQPFMVLEWVVGDESRGGDLRSWLRRGPLPLRPALDFMIDLCRGLIHANQKQPGIVHRDLKPENVLIAQDRTAKITDFGLARIARKMDFSDPTDDGGFAERRHTSNAAGTPFYMAPEQWRGEELDSRTDIYALGCVMFEMLAGRRAYEATSLDGIRRRHLETALPTLPGGTPSLDALDPIIRRCLAKRKEQRYTCPGELLHDLSLLYKELFAATPREIPLNAAFTFGDYNNRGIAYERLERSQEALEDFNRAVELDSSLSLAYSNRGTTLDSLLRHDEALADYARAIELDPANKLAYYNRAYTHFKLQRYEAALEDYSRAIALDPDYAKAYQNRANIYVEMGRPGEALADYTRAVELEPDYPMAYSNRSQVYVELERFADALADLAHAIRLNSDDASAYYIRGNLYAHLGRNREALADYTQAVRLDPSYWRAYVNRGNTRSRLEEHEAAVVDYTQALGLNPQDDKAYYNRANSHRAVGRYEEALGDYSRAIELNPDYAWAYLDRGMTYAARHRHDEALSDFFLSIQIDPSNAQAHLFAGVLLSDRGLLREALSYFERASQLGDPEGAQLAARLRQQLGEQPRR